jgi:microcystin-dependent protein
MMAAGYTTSAAKGGLFTQNGNSTSLSHVNYLRDAYLSSEALATDIAAIAAQVAADLVQTDLDTIATAADRAATTQDTVDTAADVVLTNADVVSSAASAAAAAASYDSFDDRYLGAKASEPALDNDGAALLTGALYWNSTTDGLFLYTGSAWTAAALDASGALLEGNNLSDVASAATSRTNLGLGTTDSPTFATVTATSFAGDGSALTGIATVPTGVITLWSGSTGTIPSGWVICDGTNGTPDLRDRFVVGAGSTYAVDATGGSSTTTLAEANLPAHTHGAGTLGGTTDTTGAHTHTQIFGPSGGTDTTLDGSTTRSGLATANETASSGDHSHTLTVTGSTASAGSGTSFDNKPPYYALAYIMKT